MGKFYFLVSKLNSNFADYTKQQPTMYSSGNADNITTTFGMGFNIVNAPDNEGHIFLSIPYDQSTIALSTFATQIAIPVQNTSSVPKYRQKSSGTWTEWKIL